MFYGKILKMRVYLSFFFGYVYPFDSIRANTKHADDLLEQRFRNHEYMRNLAISNVYGSHMVMRMEIEKRILSGIQRLPVLHSEFAGLESLTGADTEIGFGDYLNTPQLRETASPSVHILMEHKLGLIKHTPAELGE